jgi:hypothetical protein
VLFGEAQQRHDDATVGTWRTSIVIPGVPFEFFRFEVFNEITPPAIARCVEFVRRLTGQIRKTDAIGRYGPGARAVAAP